MSITRSVEIDLTRECRKAMRDCRLPEDMRTIGYVVEEAERLVSRKRRPLSVENAALAAAERIATTRRRLAHGTGAENWR